MSRAFKDRDLRVVFIEHTADAPCELCGTVAELRPYGPKGESVCFECGMKNEEAALQQFKQFLDPN